jgi:hypothetical protein
MNDRKKLHPAIWFVLGGLLIVLGIGAFVYSLYYGIKDLSENVIRITAPVRTEIRLDDTGVWTVFLETGYVVDGKMITSTDAGGMVFRVFDPSGSPVPVRASSAKSTYNMGSRSGTSIMEFKVEQPGTYRVEAAFEGRASEEPLVLTIIQNFMGRLIKLILVAIMILLVPLLTGILIIVLTLVFRVIRRREMTNPPQPGLGSG